MKKNNNRLGRPVTMGRGISISLYLSVANQKIISEMAGHFDLSQSGVIIRAIHSLHAQILGTIKKNDQGS